jgi:hypothetical protein
MISNATTDCVGVRQYILGLIDGLNAIDANNQTLPYPPPLQYRLGTDYQIDYRESPPGQLNATFSTTDPLIFAMSTTVVGAAQTFTSAIKIVGIVSDPTDQGFAGSTNIYGVSAQRHQQAKACFDAFVNTVVNPSFQNVVVLSNTGYKPSDHALALVIQEAKNLKMPAPTVLPYDPTQTVANWLTTLSQTTLPVQPPHTGLLVLPVDLFFGNADDHPDGTPGIINLAQNIGLGVKQQKLPAFFFAPDWVREYPTSTKPSALGGYGVPQYRCGQLMAERVDYARNGSTGNRWTQAAPLKLNPPPPTRGDFRWKTSQPVADTFRCTLNRQPPLNGPDTTYT